MNKNKIILDLCGGTGAWSKPYKQAGYDVRLVTLPEYDVTTAYPFNGLASNSITDGRGKYPMLHIGGRQYMNIVIEDIYGILAAPPCTMFSRARTTASTPRDYNGAMKIVQACLEIVWLARSAPDSGLKFWALENPMGQLRQFLGNPPNHFRGWEYGDLHVKFTDLWGYYQMPTKKIKEQPVFNQKKWSNPKIPPELRHLPITLARPAVRAITPPKFAKAFMEANR